MDLNQKDKMAENNYVLKFLLIRQDFFDRTMEA